MKRLALSLLFVGQALAAPLPLFIGTGGKSEGIYATTFDPETGKFGEVTLAAKYNGPGFLVLHPEKPLLYAIGAPTKPHEDKSGALAAFKIEGPRELSLLKEISSGGQGPCHLAIDAKATTIAVANYSDGNITTIRLDGDGLPESLASVKTHEGTGPNKERQEGPHAHGVYFDKEQRLLVPDLGLDRVWNYSFDPTTSKLGEATSFQTAPGAGPRHLTLSTDNRHAYVINELDNTVTVFEQKDGAWTTVEVQPTLPEGWEGTSYTSEIELSEDGKFLYGSNRGHDSIVVFARDASTGKLTLVQHAPCGGKFPRHFKIAPGGKWLISAHQNDNTLTALPLDPTTGKLGPIAETISCPVPICVLFAPGVK